MEENVLLNTLILSIADDTISQDDIAHFIWEGYQKSHDELGFLNRTEEAARVLYSTILNTVYKIKHHNIVSINSLSIDSKLDSEEVQDKGKDYTLPQVWKLIDKKVTQATINNHFNKGKLIGERSSGRKAIISEADMLSYVQQYHATTFEKVKKKLLSNEIPA